MERLFERGVFLIQEPDVKGGLESIKSSATPMIKELVMFIGWGGGVVCLFVLIGLFIMVGVKRKAHRVVDRESMMSIGVVLIVMVILSAVGVWSTFFLR